LSARGVRMGDRNNLIAFCKFVIIYLIEKEEGHE
jgi:hypothetical protein